MKAVISLLLLLIVKTSYSQIPQWYIENIERMEGTWLADNSEYISAQETDDTYGLEWKRGGDKNTLLGELFGMKEGKRSGTYWQFFQYYDPMEDAVIVIQVSPWGAVGRGTLIAESKTRTRLEQIFTSPEGTSSKSGHITEYFDNYETGTSYDINENGEWLERRTYKWVKQ